MCDRNDLQYVADNLTESMRELFGQKLNRVILYGSYARGNFDSESDIDIMVVVNASAEALVGFRDDVAQISSRLSLSTDDCVTISVVLQDNATLEQYRDALPYYQNVLREGVTLYAA